MDRLRTIVRGLLTAPGRAWRRLRSSTKKARGLFLKIAVVGLVAGLIATFFFGWRTFSMLKSLSSDPSFTTAGDVPSAQPPGGDRIPPAGGVNGDAVRSVLVDEMEPPRPPEPQSWKPVLSPDGFVRPVSAQRIIGPGWRRNGETAFWYYEPSVVMQATSGTPVVAAGPGIVTAVTPTSSGGWRITIDHAGGLATVYENVFQVEVAPENAVSAHTRLGTVRSRSARDGMPPSDGAPSISFRVLQNGETIDALVYMTE